MSEAHQTATSSGLQVRFDAVSKRYRRRHVDALLIRELISLRRPAKPDDDAFWALRDLSMTVNAGETVAIVGKNGSGKSTLLSLIAGGTRPTAGRVSVRGRVLPLLALGVGFELDMTAVENAYLTASLLGVDEATVAEALEDIIVFAGLGDFIHTPVRHFSSGMLARLGFAVATHVPRDVLLVDEVLAVGDQAFQSRCLERIRELQRSSLTLFFATHDLAMARRICDRGLWIDRGELRLDAPIDRCVEEYSRFLERDGEG